MIFFPLIQLFQSNTTIYEKKNEIMLIDKYPEGFDVMTGDMPTVLSFCTYLYDILILLVESQVLNTLHVYCRFQALI